MLKPNLLNVDNTSLMLDSERPIRIETPWECFIIFLISGGRVNWEIYSLRQRRSGLRSRALLLWRNLSYGASREVPF